MNCKFSLKYLCLVLGVTLIVSISPSRAHALQPFLGLSGGTTSLAGAQNQFGWDFNAKLGFWMPYFDLGVSLGGAGVTTKTDPITGRAVSGVTTSGGSFSEVQQQVDYGLYLFLVEGFATLKYPIYGLLSVTGTFVVGYLLDINSRGGFLKALGSVNTPTGATPIETRTTILFQGYEFAGFAGIELNFNPIMVIIDVGYRYSEPRITTNVPETTTTNGITTSREVRKTFEQDASGIVVRAGIKFLL